MPINRSIKEDNDPKTKKDKVTAQKTTAKKTVVRKSTKKKATEKVVKRTIGTKKEYLKSKNVW